MDNSTWKPPRQTLLIENRREDLIVSQIEELSTKYILKGLFEKQNVSKIFCFQYLYKRCVKK